jgi:Flp pilus assembly protein TadG
MTTLQQPRERDEQGAVLVHVAVALLALLAFTALVIDMGAMWVSRRQAQNAADSAALAGALSLAFDDPDDIPRAQATAAAAGVANQVWGAAPSILPATDVQLVPCPPGAPGLPDTCIRANVYRSAARSNPLPTFFAQIVGVNSQDVRATATAQVTTGNAVDCMRPWAVADRWEEHWENGAASTAPWTPDSNFDKYRKQGNDWVPDPTVLTPDRYIAPTATDPGSGLTPFDSNGNPTSMYGLQLTLKIGSAQNRISAGWFQALDLLNPDGTSGSGGADYRRNINSCNGTVYGIGDTIPVETGNMVGPTGQGVGDLVAKDPGANWNQSSLSVQGSCAPGVCADGQWYPKSPRIVPVVLFDIDFFFQGSPSGKTSVTITNIMGFFVEGMGGTGNRDVIGRLVAIPGVTRGGANVDETASFLRKVMLVR